MTKATTIKCIYCGIEADAAEWTREGDNIDNYVCDHCKSWADEQAE